MFESGRVTECLCWCQLTTQPPERLFGQTGLGQQFVSMAALTVVVCPEQTPVCGSRFGQSLTTITYSFPQAGQSQVCFSHISLLQRETSKKFLMMVGGWQRSVCALSTMWRRVEVLILHQEVDYLSLRLAVCQYDDFDGLLAARHDSTCLKVTDRMRSPS